METSVIFSEMKQRVSSVDWSQNPLGRPETWSKSLLSAVGVVMNARFPMFLAWGKDQIFLYNKSYIPILGHKEAHAMGAPLPVLWAELWENLKPVINKVNSGEAFRADDQLFFMERYGYSEETYMTLSLSPLYNDKLEVAGQLGICYETTHKVIKDRQMRLISDIGTRALGAKSVEQAVRAAVIACSNNDYCIPYAAIYLKDPNRDELALKGQCGFEGQSPFPARVNLCPKLDTVKKDRWPIREVFLSQNHEVISTKNISNIPMSRWNVIPENAIVVPIMATETVPAGVLVAGINPKRNLDMNYESFFLFLSKQIAQTISNASAVDTAESANAAKSAFLANMSHEIRTPMSAILGFTELLHDADLSAADREDAIARIDRSSRNLLRLIDDILDISKIESNKVDIHRTRFSPQELVGEVISLLRIQAEQNNLELKLVISKDVPNFAYSDPIRVRQILINLIGNAIKFTKIGEITVSLKAEEQRFIVFEVEDTGIGISESDRRKLFQPFAQADSSIARKFGGTGLGLALSRRLCERLGGNLVLAESHPGRGSRFKAYIDGSPFENDRIPLKVTSETQLKQMVDEGALRGKRILVAEDISDNQILMRFYLEPAGAIIDFASNGAEAVEMAKTHDYDVVLMDIQMPQVDGIQATRTLRASGYTHPIVALTAHAMPEEINRSLDAGCNAHLTKPIAKSELISALLRYVSH